ncbi:MAG: polysaccharide pyruvyl transferase family protein, partial [Candidatus Aenigmarchaeota archaeon]|nr:polysaccharide pyruvyl transferase family protein [Candidatus Aenigmarchaeota archaeon]
MNIGILTSHTPYNFGANLQAFASSQYILSLGHDVKIIHYKPVDNIDIYKKIVPKEQWCGHDNFINYRLPLTALATNEEDLVNIVVKENFDGLIVGADAVWRYPPESTRIPVYFMDWLFKSNKICNIPVASMSVAHMGKGFLHLDHHKFEQVRNAIDKFSYITVRDKWTQRVINKHLFKGHNRVVHLNPDPVFIIDAFIQDTWDNKGLVKDDQNFILLTLPKNSCRLKHWLSKFKQYANRKRFLVGELPLPQGVSGLDFDFLVPYPIDPIQWYLWLKNANGFAGLRFHAVVSCITTGTPFYSIDSYGSSSLYIWILNKLGFYKLGRAFDYNSKIYNLLKDTTFQKNRIHGNIANISPRKVLDLLMQFHQAELLLQKEKLVNLFENNLKSIL